MASITYVKTVAEEETPIIEDPDPLPSTLSFRGPLDNAIAIGSPSYRDSNESLQNVAIALSFISLVSGYPYTDPSLAPVPPAILALALALVDRCTNSQYYTEQLYYSADYSMAYYEYRYYAESSYQTYIGCDYSYVYSLWY